MEHLKTCKRCLYSSDHPLGLEINEHGICSGCLVHEEKDSLDWGSRWLDLESITLLKWGQDQHLADWSNALILQFTPSL